MQEASAKRICRACGDPVWNWEEGIQEGSNWYHTECHRWLKARVEQLTGHIKRARLAVRNASLIRKRKLG